MEDLDFKPLKKINKYNLFLSYNNIHLQSPCKYKSISNLI